MVSVIFCNFKKTVSANILDFFCKSKKIYISPHNFKGQKALIFKQKMSLHNSKDILKSFRKIAIKKSVI